MTYENALTFLDGRIGIGWKLRLDSMRSLLADIGDPHTKFQSVHIAGTNGKGSTAAMLESIVRTAGYKTGLYTSPHLFDVRERVQVQREKIPKEHFADIMQRIAPFIEKYGATYFEVMTTLAFVYFAESKVDLAVIETGLGGRLDATNVIYPLASIITSIDFDHTKHLGDTLEDIATEKAGIIKKDIPCIVGELPPPAETVIRENSLKQNSAYFKAVDIYKLSSLSERPGKIHFYSATHKISGELVLPVNGRHQLTNAAVALCACDVLSQSGFIIESIHKSEGLAHTDWPGRFQLVSRNPTIIYDVAHNPASVAGLVDLLLAFYDKRNIYIIVGLMQDKDVDVIVEKLAHIAYAVQPVSIDYDRAISAHRLYEKFSLYDVIVFDPLKVADGIEFVLKQCDKDSVVCIVGSHYLAGEAAMKIKGLT